MAWWSWCGEREKEKGGEIGEGEGREGERREGGKMGDPLLALPLSEPSGSAPNESNIPT